jgi:uncharacterized protein (DUF2384 family)
MQLLTVAHAMWPSARKSPTTEPDPGRVLTQATLRAADVLDVPQRTLADIIGVSASTISRAANGGIALDPATKAGELAKLWIRVFRSLDAIVGSNDDAARAWLNAPNAAFAGEKPIDRVRSAEGLIHVLHYLDTARARP